MDDVFLVSYVSIRVWRDIEYFGCQLCGFGILGGRARPREVEKASTARIARADGRRIRASRVAGEHFRRVRRARRGISPNMRKVRSCINFLYCN